MQIKSALREALISAAVFCCVMLALVSFDPRVREQMEHLIFGGYGLSSLGSRAGELGSALAVALRYQGLDNSPMTVFVAVGVVLFVIMLKT